MSTAQKLGHERPPGGLVPAVEQQRLVDSYFQSSASYWRNLYDAKGVFEVIHQQRRAIVLDLVDRLGLGSRSHILEIGCGAGWTTIALAQRGYTVEAIDAVDSMLTLTRQAVNEAGVADRVTTSLGDVHALGFPDASFNLVIGMGVAPWLHSLSTALKELARVLRPGGYLIFTTDNRWRLNHMLDPLFFPPLLSTKQIARAALEGFRLLKPRKVPRSNSHTIPEYDAYLAAAGLEKIKGMTVGFGPFTLLGFKWLPEALGVRLHNKLQNFADYRFPLLRSYGSLYIPLARKSVQEARKPD